MVDDFFGMKIAINGAKTDMKNGIVVEISIMSIKRSEKDEGNFINGKEKDYGQDGGKKWSKVE